MTSKSPRHSLQQLITLKWVLGALMGLVCVTTLFNIPGHNKLPASVTCLVVTFALFWPSAIARLPQFAWKAYAVAIIPLVLVDVLAKETIPALLDLNTWLILFRCLNHTKRREEMQLALLCLFLIIMTGILTATIVFGFQLLVFAAVAICYLLVGSSLECKIEGDYAKLERLQRESKHDVPGALGSVFDTRVLISGIALYSLLICFACLIFALIPRIDVEDNVSMFRMKNNQTLSGFSDRVQLGEVTNIKNDNSIALRVDVPETAIVPVVPYWRMLALDYYDNGSFSLSPDLMDLQNSPLSSPYHAVRYWPNRRFAEVPSDKKVDRWTFFLEPQVSKYLPVPGSFRQMTISNLSKVSIDPHMHSFSVKDMESKMFSYQLEGVDLTGRVPDIPDRAYPRFLSDTSDRRPRSPRFIYPNTLLALPEEDSAAATFRGAAREVMGPSEGGGGVTALAFSRLANQYLWARHGYSMSVTLPERGQMEDLVARWFVSDVPGHCEFFASSFVLLARAAGFPARVVVGFKGGEWNPYEKYFMVRNADAHAWAEIYDETGQQWLRVDPTPGSMGPSMIPATQFVSERRGLSDSNAFLDSIKMLWYRRIVSYDETAQKEAAIQLKDFFVAYVNVAKKWAVGFFEYLVEWAKAPWSVWRILYMCSLAALLVAAFMIQRNMALNLRELLVAGFKRGNPIRRKAGKILRRFSHVETLGNGESASEVISNLRRLRFGSKETWPNPRLVFKAARRLR